ncbi:hypothetical protein PAMP_006127 [Pampus punctatissimus]
MAAGVNFKNDLKIHGLQAERCEPKLQHIMTIPISKTMTAAPFLTHTALTPAQKQYLYTVAASYSTTHVRNLITQHYMNVLHRCTRAGYNPERDNNPVGTSLKHQSDVPSSVKHKERLNTGTRNPGKSFLPKIPNGQASLSNNTPASKHRKMKKHAATSPSLSRKSLRTGVRIKLEEEDDNGPDVYMSECMSSLSMVEWDDDTFSVL